MNTKNNPLGEISHEDFLKYYWQKKVLVVRQALPQFESPISADELAGLAYEEEVNSRIVMEKDGEHPWFPVFGPMTDETFESMPETHWTLIVNDLEKYIPDLSWITDQFRFIPEWRMDDLMCSYAADQGSVGPHIDLYDVFIIQGEGKRRWQISTKEVTAENQIKETPLRIQKDFKAEQEWILEPGDMIYIPPNVSHYGVSLGESISFSVGYRATSHADLVNDFIGHITQGLAPQKTYQDPDLTLQKHPNEITPEAVERVRKIFKEYLDPNHPALLKWFGEYNSDTKTDIDKEPEFYIKDIEALSQLDTDIQRHPASRFTFFRHDSSADLFIDGEAYTTSISFAEKLCEQRIIDINALISIATIAEKELLLNLYNAGVIVCEELNG